MSALESTQPYTPKGIPGQYVVIGILIFAVVLVGGIYLYWAEHTRKFRPLTFAIGREFKNSLPKIEGGRHKGGPNTLRIVMKVFFDLEGDEAQYQELVKTVATRASQFLTLAEYDQFELHVFQPRPEKEEIKRSYVRPMAEVLAQLSPVKLITVPSNRTVEPSAEATSPAKP